MSFRKSSSLVGVVALAAACGGSAFSGSDGGGAGNAGTSSSHAGRAGSAGASSIGGSAASGGAPSVAGTVSVAGAVHRGGGPNCFAVDCAYPVCDDGAEPLTKPGDCCPTCPPPQSGCDGVTCQPVTECGQGYELARPEGACCEGCVPKPGAVACLDLACSPDKTCPPGYVRGDLVGGCCYDCAPDPLFCNDVADCVTADRPRSCCGCPEAISQRMYDADECWSDVNAPRMIPQSCYPQVTCDAVCGVCPAPGPLSCASHRCALLQPK